MIDYATEVTEDTKTITFKDAKLSNILQSYSPSRLVARCLVDDMGRMCALGVAYYEAGGNLGDVTPTVKITGTMNKNVMQRICETWGLERDQCAHIEWMFDASFDTKYKGPDSEGDAIRYAVSEVTKYLQSIGK